MLPMDPYLGMMIVDQYRKESEDEAASWRLSRTSGTKSLERVSRLGRRLMGEAGHLLSVVGAWLEQESTTSELPLDGKLGRTA